MKMRLVWLANTRPEIVFEISKIAQVARTIYEKDITKHYKCLNEAIKYAHNHKVFICIHKLDCNMLRITAYSDAAFVKKADLFSQLGRIVLFPDVDHNSTPVSYKSYKSRRVARSVLSAEVIAFADLFDDALAISKHLEFVLRKPIPVHILTDSKSMFDTILKGSRTIEKRVMLDIYVTRQAYKSKEISNIGFVRSSHNLVDGLTKT